MTTIAELTRGDRLTALCKDEKDRIDGRDLAKLDHITFEENEPQEVIAYVKTRGGHERKVTFIVKDGKLVSTCDSAEERNLEFCRHRYAATLKLAQPLQKKK